MGDKTNIEFSIDSVCGQHRAHVKLNGAPPSGSPALDLLYAPVPPLRPSPAVPPSIYFAALRTARWVLLNACREYAFKGHVGKITLVPDDPEDEQYEVTFNDGRTSYGFNQEHLQVEQDYNYEVGPLVERCLWCVSGVSVNAMTRGSTRVVTMRTAL